MAQAQQIRSIILQNHESTMWEILRKKYIPERNTVNNMKLMILEKIRVIRIPIICQGISGRRSHPKKN